MWGKKLPQGLLDFFEEEAAEEFGLSLGLGDAGDVFEGEVFEEDVFVFEDPSESALALAL